MALIKEEFTTQDFCNRLRQFAEKKEDDEIQNDNPSFDSNCDVLIVCALAEERDRVLEAFGVYSEDSKRLYQDLRADYNFFYQRFSYAGLFFAVVTQSSVGMATASSIVSRAILALKPKLVAMTGICAGRKGKVDLGDIIIADQVYDYTAGKKYIDRFAARPLAFSTDDDIRNYIVSAVLNNDQITDSILQGWKGSRISHRISVHMKSIASGTSVIDDKSTMESAASIQDNLYGIDMESYGVAIASVAIRTKWIVIKSVQDFADGEKAGDEVGIRDFAAYASAALLKIIITNIVA